jgi:hypothetical protein
MITTSQAQQLLGLPKYIVENDRCLNSKNYAPKVPIEDRIYMISNPPDEYNFLLDIWQSSKNHLKLTLHIQENDTEIGLLRIDFNSKHKNPEVINENVPELLKQYVGQWVDESHIHYYVEGYKPLAWAIPLKVDDSFPIKDFKNISHLGDVIQAFGKRINLLTKLIIQTNIF